jgi:non-specific serine/threonine protein kinase
MLETIREFAAERLQAVGEGEAIRRRHSEYFVRLGEEAEPFLRHTAAEWVERVESDHDNIRAALDNLEASGDTALALRLAAAVWWIWSHQGLLVEGHTRLERLLQASEVSSAVRARALTGAANLALDLGDHDTVRIRAEEALALYRASGDRWGTAYCLFLLGLLSAFQQKWSAGKPRLEESARLFRELGDRLLLLQATRRLAWMYEELGDRERAETIHRENLREARAIGDETTEAQSVAVLGQYALDDGRVDEALPLLARAHRHHRAQSDLNNRYWDAVLICRLARAAVLKVRSADAAEILSCAESLFEELELHVPSWVTAMNEATLAMIHAALDDASFADAWDRGKKLTADDALALSLSSID